MLAGRWLPRALAVPLFGDRQTHGPVPKEGDSDWLAWQDAYMDFYTSTQKNGIGARVNDAGYRVLERVDLDGLDVIEIGPGALPHRGFWRGLPASFTAVDLDPRFLEITGERAGCPYRGIEVAKDQIAVPLPDASVDLILSFYSLEHLHPLGDYLDEYARILRPGGRIIGAIPNEGGLAWGLGRFLTSRGWIRRNTGIDYDKIICWEHPNFADTIVQELDKRFRRNRVASWPSAGFNTLNFSLLTRFDFHKPDQA